MTKLCDNSNSYVLERCPCYDFHRGVPNMCAPLRCHIHSINTLWSSDVFIFKVFFCKYRTAHRKQQTRHMFVFLKVCVWFVVFNAYRAKLDNSCFLHIRKGKLCWRTCIIPHLTLHLIKRMRVNSGGMLHWGRTSDIIIVDIDEKRAY